jgi:glycosyltransferase involved in cell wall biosynthesis
LPVAFVLKGYPRLSETFIAQEIRGLEALGLDIRIVSLRTPTERDVHPVHREIKAPVLYLPEYLYRAPRRVWRGLMAARTLPGWGAALRTFLHDLARDPTPNRARRFGQACVLAHEIWPDVTALHAHFIHTPASVARYAALLRGLPWTISAHAKDIWTTPAWDKREKLASCAWAVTCSRAARDELATLAPEKVALVYHGLDLHRFPPAPPRKAEGPVRILTVGRAVEKKGHDVVIEALAMLPRDLDWRWTQIGGGALKSKLKARAARAGIAGRCTLVGSRPQADIVEAYHDADLFVLASRVARDGDRDGLPNVLMEAQTQGLPCVATRVSGVPELIEDEVTGILVEPDDPAALARALEALIRNPARRAFLGKAGERRVREAFSSDAGIAALAAKFGIVAGTDTRTARRS